MHAAELKRQAFRHAGFDRARAATGLKVRQSGAQIALTSDTLPFVAVPALRTLNLLAVFDANNSWDTFNLSAPRLFKAAIVARPARLFRKGRVVWAIER